MQVDLIIIMNLVDYIASCITCFSTLFGIAIINKTIDRTISYD